MKNIYYFKNISAIGGTEQFLYEVAKKYHDRDLTIFYHTADPDQLARLQELVRCVKVKPNTKIKCDRAFYNFNIDIIDQVEAKEHIFVSHAIYQELGYKPPIDHPKLTRFIGVSKFSCKKLEEYGKQIGRNIKAELCYNPIELEPTDYIVRLVSATRTDDKTKGVERMKTLAKALDAYAEANNRHYIWTIFCNSPIDIDSPNVVFMQPRIDVRPYIASSDFAVQLSNDMETYCYTINEALGYGVPIVTTPLSILKELSIPDGAGLVCDFDMSNVDKVAEGIFNGSAEYEFYTPPKDNWGKLLGKDKSTYDTTAEYEVEALDAYQKLSLLDRELGYIPEPGERWKVRRPRLDVLLGENDADTELVKVIHNAKSNSKKGKV